MADLDDIVQKILLQGDNEVIEQLEKLGEEGAEIFQRLSEASKNGSAGFTEYLNSIVGIATAIVGATAAMTAFVNEQDEAIQKTNFLATAFGTSTEQISGIEAAFAAAGVATNTFEQFAQRLTTTIAREWPAITESIRTSATAQSEAQDRVVQSTLKVQEAQQNLSTVADRTDQQIVSAALRVDDAYRALQFAAQEAAAATTHAFESVEAAGLGVEQAEQRLAALEGRPASAADQKALALKQAQLAVDQARQAQSDAILKGEEQQAAAADKQRKLQNDANEASLKYSTTLQEANNAQQKAQLQVTEAINSRAQAEERAAQVALKSIPDITAGLAQIATGQKGVQTQVDLTQVHVRDLTNSFILLASNGVKPPTGLQVMIELSKTLANDTDHLIDEQQRLAIVQQLSQRGFNSTGAAAFELLHVLERGPDAFTTYSDAAKKAFNSTPEAARNVEEFRQAFEKLSFAIQNTNKDIAAFASPALAEFLDVIRESLTSDNGLLHEFIAGLEYIGSTVRDAISGFKAFFDAVDRTFNLEKGTAFKALLLSLIGIVAAFASPWLAIPATITLVVLAIAEIGKEFGSVKDGLKKFFDFILSYVQPVIDKFKELWGWLQKIGLAKAAPPTTGTNLSDAGPGQSPSQEQGLKLAGGGPVRGPGSSTSDSIMARLSNGEFVTRAKAVAFWGADFMHSINNMRLPGFADGGMVAPATRLAGATGSSGAGPQSTLNLTIGDRTFAGLKGPRGVIDDLSAYAVGRQTTSSGRQPSWMK